MRNNLSQHKDLDYSYIINMEKIKEKKFWDIYYNINLNILELYWKNTGSELNPEAFKSYLLELVQVIAKYKPKGFLVDSRAYHIVMSPKFQIWHDQKIIPSYVDNGISNIVFVLNQEEMIVNLSLEQTFDEEEAQIIQTHFTDSLEKARNILQNSISSKSLK